MLVLNLMGEPSVGKSSTAGGVFYELGVRGYKSEIITEVAKGFAWETPIHPKTGETFAHPIFGQQIYLLGEQNRLLERVVGKRQVAIMECPLIMTAIYQPDNYFKNFTPLVLEQFNVYNNFNILLERNHSFDNEGRVHNESESLHVRNKLKDFLKEHSIPYITLKTHPDINKEIASLVIEKLLQK